MTNLLIIHFADREVGWVLNDEQALMALQTYAQQWGPALELKPQERDIVEDGKDRRPHSRACGIRIHPHGVECSSDCPTCRGGHT